MAGSAAYKSIGCLVKSRPGLGLTTTVGFPQDAGRECVDNNKHIIYINILSNSFTTMIMSEIICLK